VSAVPGGDHTTCFVINLIGRGIVIRGSDCLAILVSAVLVLSRGHTDREKERITEAHDCYIHATTVGVSNDDTNTTRSYTRNGHES